MARKRKNKKEDSNQLMLFSAEEMSGDLPVVEKEESRQEVTEEVPSQEVTEEVPSQEVTEEVPSQKETEEKPHQEMTEEKPHHEVMKEEPSQEVMEEEPLILPNSDAKEEKKEIPEIHEPIQPSSDMVRMLTQVIRLLDSLTSSQVRLLAMQSAALLQAGIDPLETYRLPVLPGMEFQGDTLTCMAYASIVRSFPQMTDSIGVDLSSAYHEAMRNLSDDLT